MDEEPNRSQSMSTGLSLIGLSVGLAALMSSGGLALFAGAVALAFLVGSMAVSFVAEKSECDRLDRQCREAPPCVTQESDVGPAQEAGHGHHWRQTVAASRCGSRWR